MNFPKSAFLFVGLYLINSVVLFAQSPSESVRVTIKAIGVYSTYNASNEAEDYRFRFWYNDDETSSSCLKLGNKAPDQWFNVNYTLVTNRTVDLTEPIDIEVSAWEEDGCKDDCRYNDTDLGCDDGGPCGKGSGQIQSVSFGAGTLSGAAFKLIDLPPGNVSSNIIEKWYCSGKYRVRYLVTYIPPQPSQPTIKVEGADYTDEKLCEKKTITLTTATTINSNYYSSVRYEWEYIINNEPTTVWIPNPAYCGDTQDCTGGGATPLLQSAKTKTGTKTTSGNIINVVEPPGGSLPPCCYEPPFIEEDQYVWRTLGSSMASDVDNGSITFDVRSLYSLSTLKQNAVVNFRLKAVANGLTSFYSSSSTTLNVSPMAPVIGSITIDPSCPNKNSGIIQVTGISGAGEYQYYLKPGYNNNGTCNPEEDGSCFSGILTGSVSGSGLLAKVPLPIEDSTIVTPPSDGFNGSDFNIYNVPDGEFTLWLANYGLNRGSCFTTIDSVEVLKIPELSIQVADIKNVSCHGASDAEVSLTKTGGVEPFTFSLKIGSDSTGNATGLFSSLAVGDYLLSVTDGCLQDSSITQKALTIKQPAKLSESLFDSDDATCVNPGNGKLATVVSKSTGAYDTIVSGTFLYRLFKDNALYTSWESSDIEWTRGALPVSNNYQLIVTEKGSLDCNGYTKTFAIQAPEPLSITNLSIDSITCFGGTNGMVIFDGNGGSDIFTFKLSKTSGDTLTNTVGSFTDMSAGDYTLVIENDLPGCFDKVNYPDFIKVLQPDSIAISLSKSNITCFGYNDGNIFSSVSGGTPGYSYTWEEFIGSSWSTINTGSTSLSNLSAGTFRLRIVDSKSCPDFSNSISVIEPAPIGISSTIIHDIKCFGEKGTLEVVSTGGTIPYTYEYSLDNGSSFTAFTNTTLLDAGNYVVKTVDTNGCAFTDPGNHLITSPSSALDFTGIQSDYNGFNISCFGGSNGYIIINPLGGNGASYSGYQFALDGGSFQQQNTLSNINAGTHTISVIDDRGCIVSKDTLFTQTDELLSVQTVNKQDVVCYGDLSGSIEVQGSGGLSPYLFNIDSSPTQSSAQFSNLGVGSYTIAVTDLNGCTTNLIETIEPLNPRIQFQSTITDVSCFAGTDGSIALNVTDGVQPFTFNWVGQSSNTKNELTNLAMGSYAVTIIDNAGCKRDSSFMVSQPAKALSISTAIIPVCYGKSNGVITINAMGGTSPYQYSVDNGLSYQSNNIFNTVGVGTYALKVVDDKGCSTESNAEIIQRNDRPEPNFLVATRQNAFDTLIIKEISLPKPDSIYWIFDPNAIVLSVDQWSPQLKFNEPGTYFVSMTGFFAGCDYSVTKNLTLNPYDPNATPPKEPGYGAIQFVEVSPNPSSGDFEVTVKLSKKYNLSIIVYDMIGVTHYGNHWNQIQEVKQKISLPQASSGVYLIRIISDADAKDVRLILNK